MLELRRGEEGGGGGTGRRHGGGEGEGAENTINEYAGRFA